jgi:hypothetical protein
MRLNAAARMSAFQRSHQEYSAAKKISPGNAGALSEEDLAQRFGESPN